jgi:hypothetical protein
MKQLQLLHHFNRHWNQQVVSSHNTCDFYSTSAQFKSWPVYNYIFLINSMLMPVQYHKPWWLPFTWFPVHYSLIFLWYLHTGTLTQFLWSNQSSLWPDSHGPNLSLQPSVLWHCVVLQGISVSETHMLPQFLVQWLHQKAAELRYPLARPYTVITQSTHHLENLFILYRNAKYTELMLIT